MRVQVRHGLAAVAPVIHDQPISAPFHANLPGNSLAGREQGGTRRGAGRNGGIVDRGEVVPGDEQNVHRRLRGSIAKRDNLIVSVEQIRGDLSGGDRAEDTRL
jgi:hypothetical protein